MSLVDCSSGKFLLPKFLYDFACYNMLSDILAADIEENIIKLLKNSYFMMGCVVIFVAGVEVYFCLCQNWNCSHVKSVWLSAVKCRLFSYKR